VVYAHAPASVRRQVLALRIHLDDSTAHNGLLRVLPGTHTEGVLSDDAIHEFAAQVEPTDCLVPQGGVLSDEIASHSRLVQVSVGRAQARPAHRILCVHDSRKRSRTCRRSRNSGCPTQPRRNVSMGIDAG
jgi:hypothetical protein